MLALFETARSPQRALNGNEAPIAYRKFLHGEQRRPGPVELDAPVLPRHGRSAATTKPTHVPPAVADGRQWSAGGREDLEGCPCEGGLPQDQGVQRKRMGTLVIDFYCVDTDASVENNKILTSIAGTQEVSVEGVPALTETEPDEFERATPTTS